LNEEPHPSLFIFPKQLHSSATIKMPGGGVVPISGTSNVDRVEAPVTLRAYLIVAFAAFGGIFFGYDTGWMGGVLNMDYFIKQYTGHEYPDVKFPGLAKDDPTVVAYRNQQFSVSSSNQSLVTSILSAGTFFGAIIAGDLADFIGRRFTIIMGCGIFVIGGILETASTGLGVMTAGRLIAGFGVGFISAIVILYMSEIAPKKVRGAVVAGESHCSECILIYTDIV
jgi:MFS family permease